MNNRIAFLDHQRPYRSEGQVEPESPIGFSFLAHALQAGDFEVRVFCYYEGIHELEPFLSELVEFDPAVIAANGTFGVFGPYLVEVLATIRRQLPQVVTVVGGIAVTVAPDVYLNQPEIDYVCLGEGEVGFRQFCEAVCSGGDPEAAPGIAGPRKRDLSGCATTQAVKDLSQVDMDLDVIDWTNYSRQLGDDVYFYSLQTSRGCPFTCRFCYRSNVVVKYRLFPVEKVVHWAKTIKARTGCTVIRIVDDHFFVHEKRAKQLIAALYAEGISLASLDIRMENVQDDLIEFADRHGVRSLFVGTESCLDHVLKRMNKRITRKMIEEATEAMKRWPRVQFYTQLMLGTPGMSDDDLRQTIDFAIEKMKEVPNLDINFVVFQPLPGTEWQQEIVKDYPQYDYTKLTDLRMTGEQFLSKLEWTSLSPRNRERVHKVQDLFEHYRSTYRKLQKIRAPDTGFYLRLLEWRLRTLTMPDSNLESRLLNGLHSASRRLGVIRTLKRLGAISA